MLGEAYLSNSVADEYAVWYLATGLAPGEVRSEGTERLSVRRVPLREALTMALDGEITDALSLVALMSYTLKHPRRSSLPPLPTGGAANWGLSRFSKRFLGMIATS